ncbi:repulsive guidance molecule A-like isoform X2 [Haliotis rubra]|uniref:repulsive guidance molecule A-like isoform X2 n=1 Tax=Haliotis rubra TaxID=36100 RepID=UPI001EE62CB8|nr:repulsive guidance molecule A-like isoform X2 [Haliotis rubra]
MIKVPYLTRASERFPARGHTARAAAGILLRRPVWTGMASRCCHSPPRHPLTTLVFFISLAMLSRSEGFPSSSGCHVDRCWMSYQRATDILGPPEPLKNDDRCSALRTYMNCIKSTARGCQGDIRFYSVRNGVKNQMKSYNCTEFGPTVDPDKHTPVRPTIPEVCTYQGKKVYRQCGLFGDPHIRTFYDEYQTCKVKGAWPLVNNKYLTVQVTNDPVTGHNGATATSKLTVIIKKKPECTSDNFLMYQAQTDSLPGSFYDGKTHYGQHKSVELVEVDPFKHVEIHIHYIETTLVLRQIGRYFTFAIRMPEEIANNSVSFDNLQLCVSGCPERERINYQEFLALRKDRIDSLSESEKSFMSREQAEGICRDSNVVDFYFDSCVFDLMTTGDKNFTMAAVSALQDVVKLDPSAVRFSANRTSLDRYDDQYGNSGVSRTRTPSDYSLLVTVTVFLCMLFCHEHVPV